MAAVRPHSYLQSNSPRWDNISGTSFPQGKPTIFRFAAVLWTRSRKHQRKCLCLFVHVVTSPWCLPTHGYDRALDGRAREMGRRHNHAGNPYPPRGIAGRMVVVECKPENAQDGHAHGRVGGSCGPNGRRGSLCIAA